MAIPQQQAQHQIWLCNAIDDYQEAQRNIAIHALMAAAIAVQRLHGPGAQLEVECSDQGDWLWPLGVIEPADDVQGEGLFDVNPEIDEDVQTYLSNLNTDAWQGQWEPFATPVPNSSGVWLLDVDLILKYEGNVTRLAVARQQEAEQA